MFPLQLGSFLGSCGSRRSILVLAGFATGTAGFSVNTGRAGLKVCCGEGQHRLKECWKVAEKPPWPVGVAEERAGGQHGVGEHAWVRNRNKRRGRRKISYSRKKKSWTKACEGEVKG